MAGGEPVKALLYSATPDNPNFDKTMLDPDAVRKGSLFRQNNTPSCASLHLTTTCHTVRPGPHKAATVIARAVGPSGPNAEYLSNLAEWLRSLEIEEPALFDLEARVRALQGPGV